MTYTIVLERADDGTWNGLAPDLPGLLLVGDTRDQLLATAADAIADYLDAIRDCGLPTTAPSEFVAQVTVPAA
jgi:predicted RNase H-like HicB family nuclease